MKIIFITHYTSIYGANKSLFQLILELYKNFGVDPFVITPGKGEFTDELENNNIDYVNVKYFNWMSKRPKTIRLLMRFFNYPLRAIIYYKVKKRLSQCDLIHTNSSATNLGGYLSMKSKKPHIWHIREFGKRDCDLDFNVSLVKASGFMEKHADLLITISNALKSYYSDYIQEEKIKVIFNGIKYKKIRKRDIPNFNSGGVLEICFLGLLHKNKNQIEAIKAIDYLVTEEGVANIRLNIFGDGEPHYAQSLKQYVTERGLENNVIFHGFIKEIDSVLEKMDLGLICSVSEAFGRVTIEYMMNGIPVVGSNSGANSELITEETGRLYTLGDYVELAKCINEFVTTPRLICSIGNEAYKYAIRDFTAYANAEKVYSTYSELLD